MIQKVKRILKKIFPNQQSLPALMVITSTACNLDCKDCGNFCPFIKPKLYDPSDIIADIKTITRRYILDVLQVQGGEPFIYPHLHIILQDFICNKKIRNIVIATNGKKTLDYATLNLLKHPKITVRISDYRIIDTRPFLTQMEENGIRHSIYRFASGNGEWLYLGGKEMLRCEDDELVSKRFTTCPFRNCLTLEDRQLVRCSRAISAQRFQEISPLPRAVCSSLLGYSFDFSTGSVQSLEDYIACPRFMEVCRYCYGGEGKPIPAGLQV